MFQPRVLHITSKECPRCFRQNARMGRLWRDVIKSALSRIWICQIRRKTQMSWLPRVFKDDSSLSLMENIERALKKTPGPNLKTTEQMSPSKNCPWSSAGDRKARHVGQDAPYLVLIDSLHIKKHAQKHQRRKLPWTITWDRRLRSLSKRTALNSYWRMVNATFLPKRHAPNNPLVEMEANSALLPKNTKRKMHNTKEAKR